MTRVILVGLLALGGPNVGDDGRRTTAIERMNDGIELFEKGRLDEAEAALKDAIVADPTYARSHLALGQIYRRSKKFVDAARSLDNGLRQTPLDDAVAVRLWYELGRARSGLARGPDVPTKDRDRLRRQAIEAYERVVPLAPEHYRAYYRTALEREHLDEPDHADMAYRKCIQIEPYYAPCFVGLGNMYLDYGHANVGMAILDLGLKVNDKSAYLWNGLGRALMANNRPKEAIDALKRAKAIDPDLVEVLFGLGMAYAELRQRKDAVEHLQAFLQKAGKRVPEHLKRAASDAIARMQDVI